MLLLFDNDARAKGGKLYTADHLALVSGFLKTWADIVASKGGQLRPMSTQNTREPLCHDIKLNFIFKCMERRAQQYGCNP